MLEPTLCPKCQLPIEPLRRRAGDAEILSAIPTSWLDPLLTGPTSVIGKPPYDCRDIETLLKAMHSRLEAMLIRDDAE